MCKAVFDAVLDKLHRKHSYFNYLAAGKKNKNKKNKSTLHFESEQ